MFWPRTPSSRDIADTAFKSASDALATVPVAVRQAVLAQVLHVRAGNPGYIWAAGALLDTGDLRGLKDVGRFLLDPANDHSLAEQTLLIDLSSVQPTKSELPLVTSLMHAGNLLVRRAAARAIEQIASADATRVMLASIDDPDREIRYKAIQTVCDHLDGCGEHSYGDFSTVQRAALLRTMVARKGI